MATDSFVSSCGHRFAVFDPSHILAYLRTKTVDTARSIKSFAQPNDFNREIILTVLAFDMPTQPAEAQTK